MKPYYEEAGITIYHGDCREVMPELGKFHLCMTDPPYGINACNMTLGAGRKDFIRGDWDKELPEISLLLDCAKFVCIWGGNYFAKDLEPTNHWLIWHKLNDGRSFSEAEMAWTNYGNQTRHFQHHWSGEIKIHPTQKPLPVIKWAVAQCPEDGRRNLIDPFMGSGTSLVAAKDMGMSAAVGIDLEERYCEIAANRLRQSVFNFEEAI